MDNSLNENGLASSANEVRTSASNPLTFASWLIASKTAPVSQPTFLISRQGLGILQTASASKTVTLLEAPGGYGKSTLLSQWRDRLIAQHNIIGWLFLDEDDNNPSILLSYIIFALSKGGLPTTDALTQLVEALPHQQPKAVLGMLLNIVAETATEIFLVLDDFEALDEAVVEAVIAPLIRLAPDNFHLMIAARGHVRFGAPQLAAQGRLQKVGPAQLRFTLPEIEEVFRGQLSRAEILQVEELTQGWPVALQLLRSWIQQDPRRAGDIAAMSGLTDDIVEYVSDQIVGSFPPSVHTLLMEAAVLQHFSEEDLRDVCGDDIDWQAVVTCEPLRPFLLPHEDRDRTYRLHPIVKEYLLRNLAERAPARKQELHEKATWLYARTDRLLPAIRQADQSGDLELEAQVIESAGGVQIWLRHGLTITKSISHMLSQELLDRCPRLALLRALVLAKEGRVADARVLFQRTREKSDNFAHDRPGVDPAALKRDGLMVESTLLVNDCRAATDVYLENYERLVGEVYRESEFYAGHVKTFLALSHHQRGRFDTAHVYAREALQHYSHERVWHGVIFLHLHLGVIAFAQGRPEATGHYLDARAVVLQYFASDRSKSLLIDPLLAEHHYERNQLTVARRHMANVLGRLNTTEAWMEIYAAACLTAASLTFDDKGVEGALEIVSKVRQDAENRGVSGLSIFLHAADLLFLARADLMDRARGHFEALGELCLDKRKASEDATTWREQEIIYLARAAFALRAGEAQAVRNELADATSHFLRSKNIRSYIRIGALQARALQQLDEPSAAFALLADILEHCRETGYVRIFHEEHGLLADLLQDFVAHAPAKKAYKASMVYGKALLKELEGMPSSNAGKLTVRELDVLQQLKEGYQDKVIARNLSLTENTVKYHLKSIFRKFQVTSRTEAVREAQRKAL
ncbi:helix-turn-helix transcriptional regulator [Sphingomonas crocodyli]|uniref:HTH luxR-type domain-containing protein n=1 Tax=Sphingomonas crocodyli TaxID=1979270 RepID=A0A437M646_9SPHN|nr:LuxR C-terminal-related transcriptional regulator [Sphingomonas crocodyli]RVT92974.1 hypothetical protein EOD43_03455 [Sphingomonas crocodyli]